MKVKAITGQYVGGKEGTLFKVDGVGNTLMFTSPGAWVRGVNGGEFPLPPYVAWTPGGLLEDFYVFSPIIDNLNFSLIMVEGSLFPSVQGS